MRRSTAAPGRHPRTRRTTPWNTRRWRPRRSSCRRASSGRPAPAPAAGEEPAEEAAPASTEPQLPEGIVRFLKSKKRPDGTLANQELPPVIPVKLSPIQGGRPEEPQEPPPGLEVAPPQEEELEGQLQFGGVKE